MSEGTNLNQHMNVFDQIVNYLKRIDVKFNNKDKVLMLLNSPPTSSMYENLVITLIWGKETLILKEIISAILSFNLRKKISDENSKGKELVVRRHIKQECSEKKKRDAKNKEDSLKSMNVVEENSKSENGDMLSISSNLNNPTDSWILDSTCSYHMTPNKDLLHNYKLVDYGFVRMGNDDPCKVIGTENIKIKMFDGVVRTLCDVRYILDLRKNLILLGTFDCNGSSFNYEGGVLKVSKDVMTIMKGKRLPRNSYRLPGTIIVDQL
ncbi:hypothetical protein POTOM_032404 [Populus tomentosa]|uniref:Retrovirus-related Pol polyprotein from transposon TNT 1-94-like beta-barrel domain-containing protein n=1 Tax=Populus tomentosa TaxID=118781 RepID=A0A8X8CSK6_POPTO|nr:hypothetical protein POTOM_032404 [Populus tomentosa]